MELYLLAYVAGDDVAPDENTGHFWASLRTQDVTPHTEGLVRYAVVLDGDGSRSPAGCCRGRRRTAQGGAAAACDRACLEGFVDRSLDAVIARDPGRLPFARDVEFTENGIRLHVADAHWRTVIGRAR